MAFVGVWKVGCPDLQNTQKIRCKIANIMREDSKQSWAQDRRESLPEVKMGFGWQDNKLTLQ